MSGRFVGAFFLAVALCGCGERINSKQTFADLSDSDAVVTLNGEPLTWGDVKRRLDYEYRRLVFENRRRVKDPADKKYTGYRPERLKSVIGEMANSRLMAQQVAKCGIKPKEKSLTTVRNHLLSSFSMGRLESVEELAQELGVDVKYIKGLIREDAAVRDYLISKDPLIGEVPDAELKKRKARVAAYNAGCAASNAVQRAKLERARTEIESGLDFEKAGDKYGERNKQESRRWIYGIYEDFLKEGFEKNPQLADWAFSAPVGSVGGPFAVADGYSLVKIRSRTEGKKFMAENGRGMSYVDAVRITVDAFRKVREQDDTSFKRGLSEYRERKVIERELKVLRSLAQVTYPCGTNLYQRLPPELSQPTPALFEECDRKGATE